MSKQTGNGIEATKKIAYKHMEASIVVVDTRTFIEAVKSTLCMCKSYMSNAINYNQRT
jgi:hypothetical protein